MAQADGVIQNDTGANVRADLNNNIAAAFTNHSGASAPSTTYAYQFFADTANDELKIRNGANNGYITIGDLTSTNLGLMPTSGGTFTSSVQYPSGSVSSPSITFSSDTDTGIYRPLANTIRLVVGGSQPFTFSSTSFASSVAITVGDGTNGAPSIANTGDTNTGIYWPGTDQLGITAGGEQIAVFDAFGISVRNNNEVRLTTASSGYVAIKAQSGSLTSYTLTLPGNDGDAGQYLQTNGSGNLTWASVSTPAAVPTGSVFAMATSTVPSGYLECDGSAVSRSTYSALFAVTSTTYGSGDGSTTFNLPDLRGEFVRGWDNGRGVDSGRNIGTSQADATAKNGLALTDPGHEHNLKASQFSGVGNLRNTDVVGSSVNLVNQAAETTTETTGITLSGDSETRPRNVAMMYVIKT